MTEAKLPENLIDQILNDDDLLILMDNLQDLINLAATIGVLPTEFAVRKDQPMQLDGDVLVEQVVWATLADDTDAIGYDLEKKKIK